MILDFSKNKRAYKIYIANRLISSIVIPLNKLFFKNSYKFIDKSSKIMQT